MSLHWPSFDDYYRRLTEQARESILRESDQQILWSDIDELSRFYHAKFALQKIVFDRGDLSCEIKNEIRRIPSYRREEFYRGDGDLDFEFQTVYISLPISRNPHISIIKGLYGSTRYLDGFEERLEYKNEEIIYSFESKWYWGIMGEDGIASEVNSKSQRLLQTIEQKNSEIDRCNLKFMADIKAMLSARKDKLIADKEKMSSLTQKISIPLKQSVPSGWNKIQIKTSEFVQVLKPTPKLPVEYTLEERLLEDLLSFVDNQCRTFEKTPWSYKALGEEQLRDIILSSINGIFPNDATSETFVKKWKTDIHLKLEKWEILIFECKNWGWEKVYLDTIDQLIGYVTWRQNYWVVIMFSKNKDFSKILPQIPTIIQKHPGYRMWFKKISANHFVSDHVLPEDSWKIIKIHHFIYNIYSE